jgi:hypothetical protein
LVVAAAVASRIPFRNRHGSRLGVSEALVLRAAPPNQEVTVVFALFVTLPLTPARRRASLPGVSLLAHLARRLRRHR